MSRFSVVVVVGGGVAVVGVGGGWAALAGMCVTGAVAGVAVIEVSNLVEVSSFSLFSSLRTVVEVAVVVVVVEQTTSMQIFLGSMTSLG